MSSLALAVACPLCGEPAGRQCRTLQGRRPTHPHRQRADIAVIESGRHWVGSMWMM